MGRVIDLHSRRPTTRPAADRFVVCAHCGERHPKVRLASGRERCVTAFADGAHWFCRNRGCRAAWLAKQQRREG
jgi:hypothetical protein